MEIMETIEGVEAVEAGIGFTLDQLEKLLKRSGELSSRGPSTSG